MKQYHKETKAKEDGFEQNLQNLNMKLEQVLEKAIKIKIDPRKPVFFTRVKMFFMVNSKEWVENCRGMLIVYNFSKGTYFTIMNIVNMQINFDMEIYTNFLAHARFVGDSHSMHFWLPCSQKNLRVMMILESKEQLMLLKKCLQKQLNRGDFEEQLSFFRQPEVRELLQKADIEDGLLESNLRFRNEVQDELKQYFKQLDQLQKKGSKNGFKAYGLGREQWKLDEDEKKYLKQKKKDQIVAHLVNLRKQSKISIPS